MSSLTPAQEALRARWTGPGTILVDSVTVRQAIDDITTLLDELAAARGAIRRLLELDDREMTSTKWVAEWIEAIEAARAHLADGGQARKEG